MVFLAHFTGGGINEVLELNEYDFYPYLDEALKLYEIEKKTPLRTILTGIEQNK